MCRQKQGLVFNPHGTRYIPPGQWEAVIGKEVSSPGVFGESVCGSANTSIIDLSPEHQKKKFLFMRPFLHDNVITDSVGN